jgi:uncharacterized protein YbjT (DUF2867 family)
MTAERTILVAGVTGMLGGKIVDALLAEGGVAVRALVRDAHPDGDEARRRLDDIRARGVEVAVGDLRDGESLRRAVEGADGIVSAVQGGEDVIITGQTNVLRAAEQAGVGRFIPSDYAVDYRKLAEGDNPNLDLRRRFATILRESPVAHTVVLNGAFTEVELGPWGAMIDEAAGTFSYWGDGQTPVDMTVADDVARYTAAAVLDPDMANRTLQVAGDTLTLTAFHAVYQEVTGRRLEERRLGSVDELVAWIAATKRTASSPYAYLPQQYHYAMVSGKGKLDDIQNARYPHIRPLSVRQFLQQSAPVS